MIDWTNEIPKLKGRAKTTRTLHLCCGRNKYDGAVGIDKSSTSGVDIQHDLDIFPYPFKDSEFDSIICINAIEHLKDVMRVMEEIHRISKPGARIYILTPHFSDAGSYIDPMHRHHLSARSFDYFIEGTALCDEYGFYSQCRFRLAQRRLMLHRYFRALENVTNKHVAFYEEMLCYIIRGRGIYFELEVIK